MSAGDATVLGISGYFHDSSAALVRGGQIVALAAEERFTRIRHDASFPRFAVTFCLERASIAPQDLDAVVFYESPYAKFTRVVATLLGGFPATGGQFASAMQRWMFNRLWTRGQISRALRIPARKVHFVPHHLAHAFQAFSACPFDDAAILTVDAVGEWTCTSVARGRRGATPPIEILEAISYPHSLGLVYAAFTAFLGFRPNDGEASTMALAAFGKPRFVDQVRELIRIQADGTYEINQRYFDFLSADRGLFTRAFVETFGAPRDHGATLSFSALDDDWQSTVTADEQRYADIAASVQRVIEEAVLALARRALALTGSKKLCLAGGVALNAVANTVLVQQSGCDDLFIPPDPGDGGAAVGAALAKYYQLTGSKQQASIGPYLGREYSEQPLQPLVPHLNPQAWNSYRLEGSSERVATSVEMQQFEDWNQLLAVVAVELMQGKIIGWCQGRFEGGPRALGNRSILIDPRRVDVAKRLSRAVKRRAAFRPYALSIRAEDAAKAFALGSDIPNCARWMQMVLPILPQREAELRAAIHYDRTTRVQICSSQDNPRFHGLLSEVARRSGMGALLNTSFNEAGYPLVASPQEALITFARTDIDLLVVNNALIRQVQQLNGQAQD